MENEEKGILVEQVIQADRIRTHGKFHERLFLLLRFLYFVIGMLGVVLGLTLTYEIELSYVLLVAGTILICLLITAAWELPISRAITWPIVLGIFIVFGVIFHNSIFNGMLGFYNIYAGYINEYYSAKVSLAAIGPVSGSALLITLLFVSFLLAAILSLGTIRSLDGRVTALIFAVIFVLALAVGKLPAMPAFLMMLFVLVGMFSLQYSRYRESFSVRTVTVKMSSSVFGMLRWQTAAVVAVLFLLLLPFSRFVIGPAFTEGYEAQSQIREDIRNGDLVKSMETFWKKMTRGEWDWLPVDIIRSSGVHGGRLSNVKEVRDYDETHLYLDISSDLKAPLYIRGYVGSNYTGSGWKELSDKQNKEGLETGMDLISLSSQYYQVLENLYNNGDASVARRDLVISDVDANSAFSYIPYGTELTNFTAGEPFDAYPKQDTDREIFSMYYMNTQRLSNIQKLETAGSAVTSDASYRAFADSVYLTLPTKGLDSFYEEYAGKKFTSIADCVSFVRSTLEEHATYTKTPGSTPRGNDYVEYFLYENKQGVCTHFASAAVLLFRLYGIPARYVEGYLVRELSAENGAQAIMDEAAHAWAEIYVNGVGWIPIEVTPGFIDEDDLADSNTSDSTIRSDQLENATNPAEPETKEPQATVEGIFETTPETTATPEGSLEQTQAAEQPSNQNQPTPPDQNQQSQSDPNNQNNQDNSNNSKDHHFFQLLFRVILIVLGCILFVALLVFGVIYQRKMRLQRQEQRLKGEPKEALLYALARMDALCEAEGLEKISTATDATHLQESFPTMTQDKLMWLQDLLQELTFSNHAYGTELRDETAQLYRDMASDATARQSRIKKLWYRYGRCFC